MDKLTILLYDIECYQNYFMVGYSVATPVIKDGKLDKFTYNRYYVDSRDKRRLKNFLFRCREIKHKLVLVGFNNSRYDNPMLQEALLNIDRDDFCEYMYNISQQLINDELGSWKYRMFTNFDLHFEESMSLKSSAVILHHATIEELPYEPDRVLSDEEIEQVISYNQNNDMWITEDLLNVFKGTFDSMYAVIQTFNLPISSFGNTERSLVETVLCERGAKGNPTITTTYKCPFDITYKDPKLNEIKAMYENSVFKFGDEISCTYLLNGELECIFGLGGMHACLEKYEGRNLIDVDVASYYPNQLRVLDALPSTVKNRQMYYQMIKDRVALKKTDPVKASAYKIILNATFGALGYVNKATGKVGKLFDFNKLMLITITGQLLIMKLAEDLTLAGYRVVYINTDGLMIESNGSDEYKKIMEDWQKMTDLTLEEEFIQYAVLKDVNNYIITEENDGEKIVKSKGVFFVEQAHVKKLTTNYAKRRICIKAVVDYIANGTPIEDTIRNSTDIRDFILHHKFGKQFVNIHCGDKQCKKVVRWYKSTKNKNQLISTNSATGTTLSPYASENITIVDDLSKITGIPDDLDYDFYLSESYSLYNDLTGKYVGNNSKSQDMINELKDRLLFNGG